MEITANAIQTVEANRSLYFTDTVTDGSCSIIHRVSSGLVTLRGLTNQCRARFQISFSGNIAVATGGTVGPISLAVAISGEPIPGTNMISTPAAIGEFNNVATSTYIDVPRGCCVTISVQNTSDDTAIDVQNANLIIERVA